jgi:hypothetical protein
MSVDSTTDKVPNHSRGSFCRHTLVMKLKFVRAVKNYNTSSIEIISTVQGLLIGHDDPSL